MPLVNAGLRRRERGRPLPPASTSAQSRTWDRDAGWPAHTAILADHRAPGHPSVMLSAGWLGSPNPGTQSRRHRGNAPHPSYSPAERRCQTPLASCTRSPGTVISHRAAVREEPSQWQGLVQEQLVEKGGPRVSPTACKPRGVSCCRCPLLPGNKRVGELAQPASPPTTAQTPSRPPFPGRVLPPARLTPRRR